ncbi:MAG: hypothetical protein HRT35_16400 [Algicola sp.]|nr:hypothetical protein [Algicola sp.]
MAANTFAFVFFVIAITFVMLEIGYRKKKKKAYYWQHRCSHTIRWMWASHAVHHSSQRQYLDKNFGGMLVIYDHLFGTYAAKDTKTKLRYGLGKPIGSNNPFTIVFHEWTRLFSDVRQADSLGNAMVAIFGRPGALKKTKPPAK